MKILVTGAAGFIGSHFTRKALAAEHDVHGLDCLTYAGNLSNLSDCHGNPKFKFTKGDICNRDLAFALIERIAPDAVVNFAAESHVDRSICDAHPFILTNVTGTQVMLDAVRRHAPRARFLQVGTDEVYGSADDGMPFTESSQLKPNSPYAASKAAADLLALAYARTHSMDVVLTRCSNNYGPNQYPEKLIPLITTNLIDDLDIPVYGDGMNVRDWIHVEDHCSGILAALKDGKTGEVYNFGGAPRTNLEIVWRVLKLTGKPARHIQFVSDRPGHDRAYLMDCQKAKADLNWAPEFDFETGLSATIEWYVNHPEWWRPIKKK